MRSAFPNSLIILFFIALATGANASVPTDNKDWNLQVDDNGIEVHTRNLHDSYINAFRAETVLDGPLETVMAVMADPKSCLEWVHQCMEAYNLPDGSFNDRYAYSINNMPWPVSDRDYVLHIKTMTGSSRDQIVMEMEAVSGRMKKRSGYVRMTESSTVYELTRTDDGRTRMLWYQHAEPGGSLPSWLVNRLVTDIPYQSLRELNRVVQEDQYQGYSIEYDEQGQIRNVVPPQGSDIRSAAQKARTAEHGNSELKKENRTNGDG